MGIVLLPISRYARGMDAPLNLFSQVDHEKEGLLYRYGLLDRRLLAIAAPHAGSQIMLTLTAYLAQRGRVRVLDGGNRFNAYLVARTLRSLSADDLTQALMRIQVARAFTCHQVLALLEQTPPEALPTLVLDLLDTYYDESVPLTERLRLAERSATCLRALSQQAVVVVSLRPPRPPATDPTGLLDIILGAADRVWLQEPATPDEVPRLF